MAIASGSVSRSGGRNASSSTPHRPPSLQIGIPSSAWIASRSRYTVRLAMPVRFAISAGVMPWDPLARRIWTTISSRAVRSRLTRSSGETSWITAGVPSRRRRQDRDRQAPIVGQQPEADAGLERVLRDPDRGPRDAAVDLAQLPVREHPEVELAAPAADVRVTDEQADLRDRLAERRADEGDPAVAGEGALDVGETAVLGGVLLRRRERDRDELPIEVVP